MSALLRITAGVVALAIAGSVITANAAELPTTPVGREFAAWLSVFNDGHVKDIAAFAAQHFPTQAAAGERWSAIRSQNGGFDVDQVDSASDTKLSVLLHERALNRDVRADMEVEPGTPNHIVQFMLRIVGPGATSAPAASPRPQSAAPQVQTAAPAARPSPQAPAAAPEPAPKPAPSAAPSRVAVAVPLPPQGPAASEATAIAQIRAETEKEGAASQFSGAVMVARDGRTVFAAAYGEADRTKHLANTVDTRFRIGSMNKMFTATAVMQLVQSGKIRLEDPFGKYVSDYPNKAVASTVTIHQLLTHTGGTGDIFGPEFAAHRKELKEPKDYVALFGARDAVFRAGTQFEYSNYGFIILGRVIEKVSGKSYYDFVRENIFIPAGMTSTDSLPEDEISADDLAVGYTAQGGGTPHPNTDSLLYRGSPAGGGYSTVGDLIKFADAIETHKLLDAENTALMTTGKVEMGPNGAALYGYGFGDITENDVRHIGHNGGAPGQGADLSIFPRSGYAVVVLSNGDPPAMMKLATFIAGKLPVQ